MTVEQKREIMVIGPKFSPLFDVVTNGVPVMCEIREDMSAAAFSKLDIPLLILRGETGPTPTRLVANAINQQIPKSHLVVIEEAERMGPLIHARDFYAEITDHISATSPSTPEAEAFSAVA